MSICFLTDNTQRQRTTMTANDQAALCNLLETESHHFNACLVNVGTKAGSSGQISKNGLRSESHMMYYQKSKRNVKDLNRCIEFQLEHFCDALLDSCVSCGRKMNVLKILDKVICGRFLTDQDEDMTIGAWIINKIVGTLIGIDMSDPSNTSEFVVKAVLLLNKAICHEIAHTLNPHVVTKIIGSYERLYKVMVSCNAEFLVDELLNSVVSLSFVGRPVDTTWNSVMVRMLAFSQRCIESSVSTTGIPIPIELSRPSLNGALVLVKNEECNRTEETKGNTNDFIDKTAQCSENSPGINDTCTSAIPEEVQVVDRLASSSTLIEDARAEKKIEFQEFYQSNRGYAIFPTSKSNTKLLVSKSQIKELDRLLLGYSVLGGTVLLKNERFLCSTQMMNYIRNSIWPVFWNQKKTYASNVLTAGVRFFTKLFCYVPHLFVRQIELLFGNFLMGDLLKNGKFRLTNLDTDAANAELAILALTEFIEMGSFGWGLPFVQELYIAFDSVPDRTKLVTRALHTLLKMSQLRGDPTALDVPAYSDVVESILPQKSIARLRTSFYKVNDIHRKAFLTVTLIVQQIARAHVERPLREVLGPVLSDTIAINANVGSAINQFIRIFEAKPASVNSFSQVVESRILDTYIAAWGLEPGDYDTAFVGLLRRCPKLDLGAIGELLGGKTDHCSKFRQLYLKSFNFRELSLIDGMRLYLGSFKLPAESQMIDRILEAFGKEYFLQQPIVPGVPITEQKIGPDELVLSDELRTCRYVRNESFNGLGKLTHEPGTTIFASADLVYLLSFAITMVNTDLHHPETRSKMNIDSFVQNVYRVDDLKVLPVPYLRTVYQTIKANRMELSLSASFRGPVTSECSTLPLPAITEYDPIHGQEQRVSLAVGEINYDITGQIMVDELSKILFDTFNAVAITGQMLSNIRNLDAARLFALSLTELTNVAVSVTRNDVLASIFVTLVGLIQPIGSFKTQIGLPMALDFVTAHLKQLLQDASTQHAAISAIFVIDKRLSLMGLTDAFLTQAEWQEMTTYEELEIVDHFKGASWLSDFTNIIFQTVNNSVPTDEDGILIWSRKANSSGGVNINTSNKRNGGTITALSSDSEHDALLWNSPGQIAAVEQALQIYPGSRIEDREDDVSISRRMHATMKAYVKQYLGNAKAIIETILEPYVVDHLLSCSESLSLQFIQQSERLLPLLTHKFNMRRDLAPCLRLNKELAGRFSHGFQSRFIAYALFTAIVGSEDEDFVHRAASELMKRIIGFCSVNIDESLNHQILPCDFIIDTDAAVDRATCSYTLQYILQQFLTETQIPKSEFGRKWIIDTARLLFSISGSAFRSIYAESGISALSVNGGWLTVDGSGKANEGLTEVPVSVALLLTLVNRLMIESNADLRKPSTGGTQIRDWASDIMTVIISNTEVSRILGRLIATAPTEYSEAESAFDNLRNVRSICRMVAQASLICSWDIVASVNGWDNVPEVNAYDTEEHTPSNVMKLNFVHQPICSFYEQVAANAGCINGNLFEMWESIALLLVIKVMYGTRSEREAALNGLKIHLQAYPDGSDDWFEDLCELVEFVFLPQLSLNLTRVFSVPLFPLPIRMKTRAGVPFDLSSRIGESLMLFVEGYSYNYVRCRIPFDEIVMNEYIYAGQCVIGQLPTHICCARNLQVAGTIKKHILQFVSRFSERVPALTTERMIAGFNVIRNLINSQNEASVDKQVRTEAPEREEAKKAAESLDEMPTRVEMNSDIDNSVPTEKQLHEVKTEPVSHAHESDDLIEVIGKISSPGSGGATPKLQQMASQISNSDFPAHLEHWQLPVACVLVPRIVRILIHEISSCTTAKCQTEGLIEVTKSFLLAVLATLPDGAVTELDRNLVIACMCVVDCKTSVKPLQAVQNDKFYFADLLHNQIARTEFGSTFDPVLKLSLLSN